MIIKGLVVLRTAICTIVIARVNRIRMFMKSLDMSSHI